MRQRPTTGFWGSQQNAPPGLPAFPCSRVGLPARVWGRSGRRCPQRYWPKAAHARRLREAPRHGWGACGGCCGRQHTTLAAKQDRWLVVGRCARAAAAARRRCPARSTRQATLVPSLPPPPHTVPATHAHAMRCLPASSSALGGGGRVAVPRTRRRARVGRAAATPQENKTDTQQQGGVVFNPFEEVKRQWAGRGAMRRARAPHTATCSAGGARAARQRRGGPAQLARAGAFVCALPHVPGGAGGCCERAGLGARREGTGGGRACACARGASATAPASLQISVELNLSYVYKAMSAYFARCVCGGGGGGGGGLRVPGAQSQNAPAALGERPGTMSRCTALQSTLRR